MQFYIRYQRYIYINSYYYYFGHVLVVDIFNAYLLPSSNLNDFGECLLQVTDSHIRLLRFDNINEEIASWPLIALRRYGRDESKFTFECGRFVYMVCGYVRACVCACLCGVCGC